MRLAAARLGDPLLIKNREVDFTFRAMRRTKGRWGIHSMLYAADPWAVIGGAVGEQVTNSTDRAAALSFVRQAREYFTAAARANAIETQPLLYYYSFLNLAKAIAMARGQQGIVGKVRHGVRTDNAHGHAPGSAELVIEASAANRRSVSAVDELHRALQGSPVAAGN